MHGTGDPIVSPGETEGYQALVEKRVGRRNAGNVLAVYYIAGMGHGGEAYDNLLGAQIDALEQWIDIAKVAEGAAHPRRHRSASTRAAREPVSASAQTA